MINGNYYHRTHKNHKPDTRGKVDHRDSPTNLFGIQNTDREIKWVQSEDVKNDSLIGYHQVVFALSKLINIYSNVKMKEWFKCAGIRAIKTVAQTAVATIGTAVALGDVNWVMVASASALAGVLSLLTSIAGLPEIQNKD